MLKLTSIAFVGALALAGTAYAGGDKMHDKSKMSNGETQEAVIPEEGQEAVTGETQETVLPEDQQSDQMEEGGQEEPLIDEGAGEEEAY